MLEQIKAGVSRQIKELSVPSNMRPAAVLCLILGEGASLSILLTKRAKHLNQHAGQMSFPGGKLDHQDKTIVDTALREANEEIGLASDEVDVLGYLSPVVTTTGFHISPVVGYFPASPDHAMKTLKHNPIEVEEIQISPLSLYLDPNHYHRSEYKTITGSRSFWEIKNTNPVVWGATAAILKQLSDIMAN
ncbi:CoA pyrophosphatase [Alphaproteobacteria bacterium]|nr:CoA pyrophosphatase [Alphaproteobacteria bacterium]